MRVQVRSNEMIQRTIVPIVRDIFKNNKIVRGKKITAEDADNPFKDLEGFTSYDGYKIIQLHSSDRFIAEFEVDYEPTE